MSGLALGSMTGVVAVYYILKKMAFPREALSHVSFAPLTSWFFRLKSRPTVWLSEVLEQKEVHSCWRQHCGPVLE